VAVDRGDEHPDCFRHTRAKLERWSPRARASVPGSIWPEAETQRRCCSARRRSHKPPPASLDPFSAVGGSAGRRAGPARSARPGTPAAGANQKRGCGNRGVRCRFRKASVPALPVARLTATAQRPFPQALLVGGAVPQIGAVGGELLAPRIGRAVSVTVAMWLVEVTYGGLGQDRMSWGSVAMKSSGLRGFRLTWRQCARSRIWASIRP